MTYEDRITNPYSSFPTSFLLFSLPMKLGLMQRQYIRGCYRAFSDKALGRAVGADTHAVRKLRNTKGWSRSDDDQARIRSRKDSPAPEFDGTVPRPWHTDANRDFRFGLHAFTYGDYFTALGVLLSVLAVYWTTLPPTVTGEDAGELITAAYALGIPHPPGYPAWCLLAHPFTWLPFGTIAWRVALSSAVFAAGACGVLSLVTIKLTSNRWAGVAAGLACAFSREVWEQAIIPEVYGLNILFLSLCVLLLVLWYESRKPHILYLFAFLFGLGAANHNTMQLMAPAFMLFVLSVDWQPWRRWKVYAGCIGIAASTLVAAYLYLPIRSRANPPVDWGNPETWDNFMAVVRREQFNFLFAQHDRSWSLFVQQFKILANYVATDFTVLGWIVLPIGLALYWRRNRHLTGFIAGVSVLLSMVFMVVLNYGTTKQELWINNVFFIPFYWCIALGFGLAVAGLTFSFEGKRKSKQKENRWMLRILNGSTGKIAIGCIGIAISLALIPMHYASVDKSQYFFARDYGTNILNQLDENALYIPTADHATFPLLYLQAVEGMRPDVTIGNKYGYIDAELYEDIPEATRATFRPRIPSEAQEKYIETWIIDHTDRPVYFTTKRTFPELEGVRVVNDGLIYKVLKPGDPDPAPRWEEYTWHTLAPEDTHGEYTAELILSDYYFARGRDQLAQGDKEQGLQNFEKSLEVSGASKEALNNVGSACAEYGAFEQARTYFEQAVNLDPDYLMPSRNLMQVYLQLEQYEAAVTLADKHVERGTADPRILRMSATALKQLGQTDKALDRLLSALKVMPDDATLLREIGLTYYHDKHDRLSAMPYLHRSLALDPNQPDLMALLNQGGQPGTDNPGLNPQPSIPGLPAIPKPNIPGLPQNVPGAPRVP
jgi:Flp pilus assembly protein TadD